MGTIVTTPVPMAGYAEAVVQCAGIVDKLQALPPGVCRRKESVPSYPEDPNVVLSGRIYNAYWRQLAALCPRCEYIVYHPESPATELRGFRLEPRQTNFLEDLCYSYAALYLDGVRVLASGDPTWPIGVHITSGRSTPDLRCGQWLFQAKGRVNRPIEQGQEQSEDEERRRPEFVWNRTLHRARKAAQEYSKETHADY